MAYIYITDRTVITDVRTGEEYEIAGDCTRYPVDTLDQIQDAAQALFDAGESCADIWRGEGPDAIKTSAVVWVASPPASKPGDTR